MIPFVFFLWLAWVNASLVQLDETPTTAEDRLFHRLFDKYNKDARPVLHDTDTVNVTFGMTLSQIVDVVSVQQQFDVHETSIIESRDILTLPYPY